MRLLVFLLACAALALAGCPAPAQAPGPGTRSDAILGGKTDFNDPAVFMLEMTFPGGHGYCTSTLIGRRTLLTAAHCVVPEGGQAPTIRAMNRTWYGFAQPADWQPEATHRAHPLYRAGTFSNDLALVLLQREPPVPVREHNREPLEGLERAPATIVGYGITTSGGTDFGLKRAVDVLFNLSNKDIVYGSALNFGTCQGDSGGPALHTFPDGGTRVVAITSFGPEGCGKGSSERVDGHDDFIEPWFDEYERPHCEADGQCQSGCNTPDPDCACVADHSCTPTCASPANDPDCADACTANGVCATVACPGDDPDCQPVGSACGRDEHCASRHCEGDGQHDPYCRAPCAQQGDCPPGMQCEQSWCALPTLPAVAADEPCTPGESYCADPRTECGGDGDHPDACRVQCLIDTDCGDGRCLGDDAGHRKFCIPAATLTLLPGSYDAAPGCTQMPGASLLAAGLLLCRRRI